jgi:hypothetical protein
MGVGESVKRCSLGLLIAIFLLNAACGQSDDLDQDGVLGQKDNCPDAYNPDQADSDGDGFGDACDKCPNEYGTDKYGCPQQQLGPSCKLDSDGDGVSDCADQCPNEYGTDKYGCPQQQQGPSCKLDSDGDGVYDCADKCPNEYGTDKYGCPQQQQGPSCKLDSDSDGVSDCADQCPNEYGTGKAGCPEQPTANCKLDSDRDGVNDCVNQCPNEYGTGKGRCPDPCSMDSDKDGVNDCLDQCPKEQGNLKNGCPAQTTTTYRTTTTIAGCSLSLCDCKCYPRGMTPEESRKVLCGINCLKEAGVSGCVAGKGGCIEVRASTTTTLQSSYLNVRMVLNPGLGGRAIAEAKDPSGVRVLTVLVDDSPRRTCYGRSICTADISDLASSSRLGAVLVNGNGASATIGGIRNISRYIASIPCSISGVLNGFIYPPGTVAVEICEGYRLPGINGVQGMAQCRAGSRVWRENVSQSDYSVGLEYGAEVSCNGTYLVRPVNIPKDRECEWQGTWTASRGSLISINNSIQNNVDFTFNPADATPIRLVGVASPLRNPSTFTGQGGFDLSFNVDAEGYRSPPTRIWLDGQYMIERFSSDESGPLQNPPAPNRPVAVHAYCNGSACPIAIPNDPSGMAVRFNLSVTACDAYGNKADAPYTGRFPSEEGDLSIVSAEPVQVLYGVDLVKEKGTSFGVSLRSSLPYPVETRLRLILPNDKWRTIYNSANNNVGVLPADWRFPELWGPIKIPANSRSFEVMLPIIPPWQANMSFTSASDYAGRIIPGRNLAGVRGPDVRAMPMPVANPASFSVEVDPENRVAESDEGNNRMDSRNYNVVTTRGFKFAFFRVFGGVNGTDCPYNISQAPTWDSIEKVAKPSIEYVLGVYPIADGKISYTVLPTYIDYPIFTEDRATYLRRQYRLQRSDYDWAVGVTCGCCGATCGWDVKSILIGNESQNTHNVAHEMGHITNVGGGKDCYGCDTSDVDCNSCRQDRGYWVNKLRGYPYVSGPPLWWWNSTMHGNWSTSPYRQGVLNCVYMDFSNFAPYCWQKRNAVQKDDGTSMNDGYVNIMNRLANPRDPEGLMVSGSITKDNKVKFDPFIRIHNTMLDIEPGAGQGDYSIALYGIDGSVLSVQRFQASFLQTADPPASGLVETDVTGFAYVIGWDDAAKMIALLDGEGKVLAERKVSPNAPKVNVIYPNGGETVSDDAPLKVAWKASDADGDSMTYGVAISPDNGVHWLPLAIDLTGNEYSVNPSQLEDGKAYIVRVTATDGVNTGEDLSDGMFAIAKPQKAGEKEVPLPKKQNACIPFLTLAIAALASGIAKTRLLI